MACAVGLGAMSGCGDPSVDVPSGPVAAGNTRDLSGGNLRVTGNVAVGRDTGGIYAMSAVCTHAGCPTRAASEGLFCGCHGSVFDKNGEVLRGPARSALPHFKVELAPDGSITVQAGMTVAPDTRVRED
jgi:Rieske Fe-S protein